jgi:hypothetical protein
VSQSVDVRDSALAEQERLRTSARGWHGVQLAVLGFIGLCGALHDAAGAPGPAWVQRLAAVLVLVSLALACVATALVAGEAWPVRPGADGGSRHPVGHLRLGIALTFLAVGLAALATSSSWWPAGEEATGLVVVSTDQGTFCGRLLDSTDGTVVVDVSGQQVAVPLARVSGLRPTSTCG